MKLHLKYTSDYIIYALKSLTRVKIRLTNGKLD